MPSVVGEAVAAMVHALAEAEVTSSEAAATDGQELQEALVATAAVAVARRGLLARHSRPRLSANAENAMRVRFEAWSSAEWRRGVTTAATVAAVGEGRGWQWQARSARNSG